MAFRVPPTVRQMFICRKGELNEQRGVWALESPVTAFLMPEGSKKHRTDLAVYVELAGGIGTWNVGIEFRCLESASRREPHSINSSSMTPIHFTSERPRLCGIDKAFTFKNLPLREGLYEFRIIAELTPAETSMEALKSNFVVLQGVSAELRVLDSRKKL